MQSLKIVAANIYLWAVFIPVTLMSLLIFPFLACYGILTNSFSSLLRRGIRLYGFILICALSPVVPVTLTDRSGGFSPPVIFTPNHTSSLDPYLFGLTKVESAFATSWPFKIPIYSIMMRFAEYIDIRKGWDELKDKGGKLLDKGCSLIIWPEGHRSRDGRLGRFKKGAFKLSCMKNRPVVPVCIKGAGKVLPPGRKYIQPGKIELVLLPPVYPPVQRDKSCMSNEDCAIHLRNLVKTIIQKEMAAS